MDAFYASVEQRDFPEYRGKPLIVGGTERRGVVCAASYEVRPFGVRSAMPMVQAMRLCPHAIVVRPRMDAYIEASSIIMDVMANHSPVVEPLSLDEAFIEMTGTERLFGPPQDAARSIKDQIFERTDGLTCTVGIAKNKFLAKLASDLNKPDGITLVPFDREAQFIAPLELERIWGVGKKTAKILHDLNFKTIGDIARADSDYLRKNVGEHFTDHIQNLARGLDSRKVVSDRGRKSVGAETTLEYDVSGKTAVKKKLRPQCERVAKSLRAKGLKARGVRFKIRYSETFKLATRQTVVPPFDDSRTIFDACCELMSDVEIDEPIRLVGAAAFDLVGEDEPLQTDLFGGSNKKQAELERTMDAINQKFDISIGRGADFE